MRREEKIQPPQVAHAQSYRAVVALVPQHARVRLPPEAGREGRHRRPCVDGLAAQMQEVEELPQGHLDLHDFPRRRHLKMQHEESESAFIEMQSPHLLL